MGKYFFLFLSFLSGAIELGFIIYGIRTNLSVLEIVGLGIAYQIGNLVPNPFKLNKWATTIVSGISLLCFGILLFYFQSYWLIFLGVALMAAVVQSLRTSYKQKVHTALKRSSRIIGFFAAPFISMEVSFVVSIILVFGALYSKYKNNKLQFLKPKIKYIHMIMLAQQVHYFCYCYFIAIMIFNLNFINKLPFSPLISVAACFALGWVSYTWIPLILKKDTYAKYYIISHIYLFIVLVLMGLYSESIFLVILWILTGFGGGTGYCIEKIDLAEGTSNENDMIFIGNLGHILGVLVGMGVYMIFKSYSSTLYLGSVFTAIATIMMIHYNFKYLKKGSISKSRSCDV